MKPQTFTKSVVFGSKTAPDGAEVTAEILAKINRYALKELSAEEVYVRKFILAHNLVDRDRERFSESLLDDFANTLAGKSFLFGHDRRNYLPFGLFFDASTEEITPEQFKAMTGEDPRLPEGFEKVNVLWAWFYLLKTSGNEDLIANIEGGTYRHASIGFSAADLAPVKGEYDQILFWEYASPGEALEGSLVWLGAQHGATSQKVLKEGKKDPKNTGGEMNVKILLAMLSGILGKTFAPETNEETLAKAVDTALKEKDATIGELETKVKGLESLAEEGKAYRKELVNEYVRMKAALDECDETPEAADGLKAFAKAMGINFLKTEVKHLQARMEKKFPDKEQLKGDMRQDKSNESDNPLIPKEEQ